MFALGRGNPIAVCGAADHWHLPASTNQNRCLGRLPNLERCGVRCELRALWSNPLPSHWPLLPGHGRHHSGLRDRRGYRCRGCCVVARFRTSIWQILDG